MLWVVFALFEVAPRARSAAADPLPDRTARLVAVARVWAHAKFFHPYLAYKDIDWDAALIAAIPKLDAATAVEQYRAAVQELLGKLGDSVTRVENAKPALAPRPTVAPVAGGSTDWLTTPSPGVVLVDLGGFAGRVWDYVAYGAKGKQAAAELAKAKVAVIDLRTTEKPWLVHAALEELIGALPAIDEWPLERAIEHRGYRGHDEQESGLYYSTFVTVGARAPKPAPKTGPVHVVFIADERTSVPAAAFALQVAGRARILASAPLADDAIVETVDISIGGGLSVRLRVGELLWPMLGADIRAPSGELRTRALALAKTLVTARATPRQRKLLALPPLHPRDDLDYRAQPYPSRPLRLLAGIRVWAALEYFNPYRYLSEGWVRVLRETLPRLDAAANSDAYLDVLREMSVRAGDGHIGISIASPPVSRGMTAIEPRLVDGKLVVERLVAPAEAKQLGLAIGDAIESVDGKPTAAALAAKRLTVSGSTPEARSAHRMAAARR